MKLEACTMVHFLDSMYMRCYAKGGMAGCRSHLQISSYTRAAHVTVQLPNSWASEWRCPFGPRCASILICLRLDSFCEVSRACLLYATRASVKNVLVGVDNACQLTASWNSGGSDKLRNNYPSQLPTQTCWLQPHRLAL